MKRGLFVIALVLTCGSLALGGDSIGINFVGGDNPYTGPELGGTITGTAGVVPRQNWNNMLGFDSGGPSAPLIDNEGATTATTVEWVAPNVWNLGGIPDDGGNGSLMKGYLDNGWNLGSVTVRNVPWPTYNVYVYGESDRAAGVIDGYLINGHVDSQQNRTEGGAFTGDLIRGVNYVRFPTLSADSNGTDFTVTAVQVDGNAAAPFSGIQVVNAEGGVDVNLTVDRDTGNLTLSNETLKDQTFTEYSVLSEDGALLSDEWIPITGDGWSVTSATAEDLSQETTGELTLAPGESIDLGDAWAKYYDENDLRVLAVSTVGTVSQGAVSYVGNNDESFVFGDLNFDGALDAGDWALQRDNFNGDLAGLTVAQAYPLGDLNGDGVNNMADQLLFKDTYEAAMGAGSFAALTAVPEPTSLALLGLAGLLIGLRSLRRQTRGVLSIGLVLAAATGMLVIGNVADAQSISLNFSENSGNQEFVGGEPIGPLFTDSANWNNTNGQLDLTAGTIPGLIDDSGANTGASVTWSSSSVWWNSDGTGDDQARMAVGYLDDGDTDEPDRPVEITFDNIPYDTYRVYGLLANDWGDGLPGEYNTRNFDVNGQWVFGGDDQTIAPAYGNINANDAATGSFWSPADGVTRGNYWMIESSGETLQINGLPRSDDLDARGTITAVIIEDALAPANVLTLEVNLDNGGATTILNETGNTRVIDAYQLVSGDDSLNPDGWSSLQSQNLPGFPAGDGTGNGWEELGNPDESVVAELYLEDVSQLAAGASLSLGNAAKANANDIAFQYRQPGTGSGLLDGLVRIIGPPCTLGDVNVDGKVDGLDVDPFVDVLLNGPYKCAADMNEDMSVDGLDVDPFVAAIVGGGVQAVPEPTTLVLLSLALVGLIGYRCARR